ncbi:MAG TPA: fasciclin domain-containing protein [Anaerolineales bacterium]|nr:fasciclin domain-containing protein [Anaerolineales bacterium]
MKKSKVLSILFVVVLLAGLVVPTVAAKGNKPGDTIVEIASSNGNFDTLVAAVSKAGLVDTLNGNRMFTVFAPTDAAFDAAAGALGYTDGMDLVNSLDKATLTEILLYHVAPGERFSGDVVTADRIRMMNKDFTYVDGLTIVGNGSSANLVPSLIDIDASNGVIHVIDFVLLP